MALSKSRIIERSYSDGKIEYVIQTRGWINFFIWFDEYSSPSMEQVLEMFSSYTKSVVKEEVILK